MSVKARFTLPETLHPLDVCQSTFYLPETLYPLMPRSFSPSPPTLLRLSNRHVLSTRSASVGSTPPALSTRSGPPVRCCSIHSTRSGPPVSCCSIHSLAVGPWETPSPLTSGALETQPKTPSPLTSGALGDHAVNF